MSPDRSADQQLEDLATDLANYLDADDQEQQDYENELARRKPTGHHNNAVPLEDLIYAVEEPPPGTGHDGIGSPGGIQAIFNETRGFNDEFWQALERLENRRIRHEVQDRLAGRDV